MSFETSKRRIVEPEHDPGYLCANPDRPVSPEGALTPGPAPEDALDLDALGRLRTLFELLDNWDQKEKTDGK
jgi:hypothetical protein